LLRVFVPSPEGDWLSDKSVLECEAECKRAGVSKLLRMGDVVWDIAVGDEGNVGRLVWDGSYLIVSSSSSSWDSERSTNGFSSGFGLHVFDYGRTSKVYAGAGVPSVVFPSCDTTGVDE
jgi:hypothetical protein